MGPAEWGVKDELEVQIEPSTENELKKRLDIFGINIGGDSQDSEAVDPTPTPPTPDATPEPETKGGKKTKSADNPDSSAEDPKTTPEAKSSKEPKTTKAPSTADATTTSDEPTSTPESTTANTPTPTTSNEKTTATAAAATTEGTILQCMVTNVITTSECSFSRGKKVDCHPALNTATSCAPGLICQTDSKTGADVCLKRDSKMTTSGITVTIFLVSGLLIATIAVIITNYQSRASRRRKELARAAYLGGSAYGKGGKGPRVTVQPVQPYNQANPSGDYVPLMEPGGARMDSQNYQQQYEQQTDYYGENPVSANEQARAPKLHPGLGALGQDYR